MPKLYQLRKESFKDDLIKMSHDIDEVIVQKIITKYEENQSPFHFQEGLFDIKLLTVHGLDNLFVLSVYKKNSSEIDERLKFLGEISTNLFHEINGPLNIMISSLEILKLDLFDNFSIDQSSQISSRLETFEIGLVKMNNIIQGLHNFAQGKHNVSLVDLEKFHKATSDFANIFLIKNQVKLTIKSELSKNFKMQLSETLFSQVLINLIKNASDSVKLLPIFNRWISITVKSKEDCVVYEITDGGKAISPEIQKKLFTYGFTTKNQGEGTGIGLSFCKKVIDQHRGEILYNKDSENASFIIKIPIKINQKVA